MMTDTEGSTGSQPSGSMQDAPLAGPRQARQPFVVAVPAALFAALLSLGSILVPRRFARHVREHPALVPVWQIALLLGTSLASACVTAGVQDPNVPPAVGPVLVLVVLAIMPQLLMLFLLWLLVCHLVRPIAGRWDESARRSLWTAGALWVSFTLPLTLGVAAVAAAIQYYMRPHGDGQIFDVAQYYKQTTILTTAQLVLGVLWGVQVLRGIAGTSGGHLPALEPLCRDCGYNLEGVRELHEAGAAGGSREGASQHVCSECGCELALSLDPALRQGTLWTRGQDLGLRSYVRTLGQVLRRPGDFFTGLPLAAPRLPALRFGLLNVAVTFVLAGGLFLADYAMCERTRIVGPILAGFDMHSEDPARSCSLFWWLAALNTTAGTMLALLTVVALVAGVGAAHVGGQMSKYRGRNMHPAGLLLATYLSPHLLAASLLSMMAFLATRVLAQAVWPELPAWVKDYIADPEAVAVILTLIVAALGVLAYHRAGKRATGAIQYANC